MKKIDLYSDGACSGNPGPGGWGCVLIFNNVEKTFSGFEAKTTNNRMELSAVIEGFKTLKEPCEVQVFSDSAYVVNAFNQGWIKNWLANNWKRGKQREPVLNRDLWQELIDMSRPHKVTWMKVKGHSGNKYNEQADKLAVSMIEKNVPKKKKGRVLK